MTNSLALQLSAAGLDVFPCRADKGPAVPKGSSWLVRSKCPPETNHWPSSLVGVPVPAGVVVLDLDTYKGATRDQVDTALGCALDWDKALIQHTQQGGQHYAFAVDWPVKFGSNIAGVKGLDTRTTGKGYIATGTGYTPAGFGLFAMAHPSGLPSLPDFARHKLEHVSHTPIEQTAPPEGDQDIDTIRDALRHVNPGCERTEWVRIGLALRHHFHNDESTGQALFDEWSRGSLTSTGEAPANYAPETMDHQWSSFKVVGGVTVATLFYTAIAAGWTPPAGIDTSAAFGGCTEAQAATFDSRIDDITEYGGNPKHTNDLITNIQATPCNPLQRGILLATLHRELKDAGLLTKDVRRLLEGQKPPRRPGEYAKNHTENAATFIDTNYPEATLRRSQEVWYQYTGKAWEELEDGAVRHLVAIAMSPSLPQHATVSGTYNMMCDLVNTPGEKIGQIDDHLVLMQNGVLNLITGDLYVHSRGYFTTNILPYNFNINARADTWLGFLGDIFEGDAERIELLQEWFGYMLSSTYEHQKVMLLLGPSRCGKGTIGRILNVLTGAQNFSGGSLTAFAKDSYVESLRTKTVVFIGDAAKNIPRAVIDVVTERIKGISGGDIQSFDRKYKASLSEVIPSRITIATNHVPRLFDDSGALASRLLVLPFNVSYYGREDPVLFNKLVPDIEGIAIWALQGLARLRNNGRFTVPAASQAETDYIREAYSPLNQFLNAACVMDGDGFVSAEEVYNSYKQWALLNQEDMILSRRAFVASFKDLTRGMKCRYGPHRVNGKTIRGFKHLSLTVHGQSTQTAFKVVQK